MKFIEIAAGISNQWSLAAFAIAAILYIVLRKQQGKVHPIAWGAIGAIVLIGLVPMLAPLIAEDPVYQVRVTVLGPQKTPVEDAKVWSSVGGEPKKVSGGWQFDVPAATRPSDGTMTIYAAQPSAFLTGHHEIHLADDRRPAVSVQLQRDTSAMVRGIVMNEAGNAIPGARVSVVGYEPEAMITGEGGQFALPAHAAVNQQVQLHAEKQGFGGVSQWHPAGDEPATVVLSPSSR